MKLINPRLTILIAKQPEEYGCYTEGCNLKIVDANVPVELKLSQIRRGGHVCGSIRRGFGKLTHILLECYEELLDLISCAGMQLTAFDKLSK